MKYVLKDSPHAGPLAIAYQKELNPSQYEVVTRAEGACLVLAGAGSGKTRTLIYRVSYLLEKGVQPEEILLVTFTNKAAGEMRTRVEALLKSKSTSLWCGTFHHIGHRILRQYGREIGLSPDFSILDDEDSRALVKTCAKLAANDKGSLRFPKPGVVQSVISLTVNTQRTLREVVSTQFAHLLPFLEEFEKIKRQYEEKKAKTNNLDYDDLLLKWKELLEKSVSARERFSKQFRYVLVDEYQDTNHIQHAIVHLLSSFHKNILVVGDDAQSIYSFRGAEIKNILNFPEQYDNAKIFKLETNYRSTKTILELANQSIAHNVHQFPKVLKSALGEGDLPQWVKVRDARQEARFIAQRISELQEQGIELSQIAVLFRAHYQAAELELELTKRGAPYVVRGGIRFFEQAHVKDVLAYLKILQNPSDEISWIRALTLEAGIGASYADKIFQEAEKEKFHWEKVLANEFASHLPAKVRDGFVRFKKVFKTLVKEEDKNHPDVLIEHVLDHGYNKHVLLNFENAQERLEDLRQLVNFAHTYKNLKTFMADATLREGFKGETIVEREAPEEIVEPLLLSTIHQAKGLEWKAVFVMGLSEGLFPHARSMNSEDELEEERRLFYVAVTRAKEQLTLTHPIMRYDYSAGMVIQRPSIFMLEIPSTCYDEIEVEESSEDEERTIYLDND